MRKKIITAGILVILIIGVGVYVFSRAARKSRNAPQYGLLKPKPGEPVYIPQQRQNTAAPGATAVPNAAPNTSAPKVAVPNTVAPKNTTAEPPKGRVLGAEQPAKKVSEFTIYRLSQLGFEVSVPSSWQHKLETRDGNVLAFFQNGAEMGEVEVIPSAQESLDQVAMEVQAKGLSFQQTSALGQPALAYTDPQFGATVAFVWRGNVYYFRGAMAEPAQLTHARLF